MEPRLLYLMFLSCQVSLFLPLSPNPRNTCRVIFVLCQTFDQLALLCHDNLEAVWLIWASGDSLLLFFITRHLASPVAFSPTWNTSAVRNIGQFLNLCQIDGKGVVKDTLVILGFRNLKFWQGCLIESLKVKVIHSF